MSFWSFFKEKMVYLFFEFCSLLFAAALLRALGVSAYAVLFVTGLLLAGALGALALEFLRKRGFYNQARRYLEQVEPKYLLSELLEEPGFFEGRFLCETLRAANKAMNDNIACYRRDAKEYREYIETWVHEIKTPIASARLIAENNRSPAFRGVLQALGKIEGYVEQALYYARSGGVEKDYLIRKTPLRPLVAAAVKQNADELIANHVAVELEELDFVVHTDEKWMFFILRQLIDNAVKYKNEEALLRFSAREGKNGVTLTVADNGVGMPEEDVPRAFDKGFTGKNGRRFGTATGMGLYLCKKLCERMGHSISLSSQEGGGTEVRITFPQSGLFQELGQ